jgi:Spy/CpxP family protein refolding chaperone
MRRNRVAGLALALTLMGATTALAQEKPPEQSGKPRVERGERFERGDRRGPGGPAFLLRGIQLSDAQKTQLQAVREKHRAEMEKAREQGESFREQMRAAREANDTTKLRALRAEAMQRMREGHERMAADVRAVLTPEQRVLFDKNLAEAREAARDSSRFRGGHRHRPGQEGGRQS